MFGLRAPFGDKTRPAKGDPIKPGKAPVRAGEPSAAHATAKLYAAVVDQARLPYFYTRCAVHDNVDGRFDMIAMHMFLLLNRLRTIGTLRSEELIQQLMDIFVRDMDDCLREMGVGDLSVGKKVRVMAEAMLGRLDAYRTAFASSRDDLSGVIARNIYRGAYVKPSAVSALIGYFYSQADVLRVQDDRFLLEGAVVFHAPHEEVIL